MPIRRLLVCLGLAAGLVASVRGETEELNAWPAKVTRFSPAGNAVSQSWLGPLFFSRPLPEGGKIDGFRPFYIERTDAAGRRVEIASLYPLFTYRADAESYTWSVFNLINRTGRPDGASPRLAGANHERFDVWPFYFSRNTGDPATSYRGLLPVAGTIKSFYGYDRVSWILFPLYTEVEKRGATTTLAPWPIVRVTRGAEHGFAIWPLFGWRERPNAFQQRYLLWPLIWNNTIQPHEEDPAGTPATRQVGFIPFYTRETRRGYRDENFAWPFFGTTERTLPYRYHETRYLWPFFVQGDGDNRHINRWGPFYTHSVIKGYDKTWFAWPIWRHATWEEDGVAQKQISVLFRVYWSLEQRSLTNPGAAPATKTHLWPLFSAWNNGAGRRQFQLLSPFEVFFPRNDLMRETWTPLFALYRFNQTAPGENRSSILWDAITWEKHPADQRSSFHLGPLLSVESDAGQKRVAIGNGLVGFRRDARSRAWRVFWLDFPPKRPNLSTAGSR